MPARPRKGKRFGGGAAHQKAMMANMVASLIAAEGINTTEAKAKALRPIAEKMITKAKKGGVHNHREVVKFLRDRRDGHQAVRRDRPSLRGPRRWLHPHHQARPAVRRQRPDGPDRIGLIDATPRTLIETPLFGGASRRFGGYSPHERRAGVAFGTQSRRLRPSAGVGTTPLV